MNCEGVQAEYIYMSYLVTSILLNVIEILIINEFTINYNTK